jgi:hypothetical protein
MAAQEQYFPVPKHWIRGPGWLHGAALHCSALSLHCTALRCAPLYCTALHSTALHFQCTAPPVNCATNALCHHCTALRHCTARTNHNGPALHCTALQRHCTAPPPPLHSTATATVPPLPLHSTALLCSPTALRTASVQYCLVLRMLALAITLE